MIKTNKNQIYFVIPAYNESKVIKNVIKKLHDAGYNKLVIIDDGSKDNTYEILTEINNIYLLKHEINRGQGASLKTGIEFCLNKKDCKYIVTFDSDGQHRIEDLSKFIEKLDKKECDICLGSRFLTKESKKLVPFNKRIILKIGILVTRILSNIKLTDVHNGYRVMNRDAAKRIEITLDGFEHASEILDEISKKKIPYKEVPVLIDYTTYSKQKGQKISNAIRIILKIIFKR